MKRHSVITAMVLGVSILTTEAMYAAPVAIYSPMHAMYSTEKLVKFNVHNATNTPIKVKAGDADVITLGDIDPQHPSYILEPDRHGGTAPTPLPDHLAADASLLHAVGNNRY